MNPNSKNYGIKRGILLLLLCHFAYEAILLTIGMLPLRSNPKICGSFLDEWILLAMFCIGFTQIIYGVPLCFWMLRRRRIETLKGVIVGMALTALINGGCYVSAII